MRRRRRPTERDVRRAVLSQSAPGESDAARRAWKVLKAAYEEREPIEEPDRSWRPLVAVGVAIALLAAVASPPGRALVGSVRDAIGREKVVGVPRARPALFSLPADGRLLVVSERGPWVVGRDGSKRLLGDYTEASWSPHGLHVVAARRNELVAMRPDGTVRWTLSRPQVREPRWGGKRDDTRIAYLSGSTLRVVAGDNTDDRGIGPAEDAAPAWRPVGETHTLTYADEDGNVRTVDVDSGDVLWTGGDGAGTPSILRWSTDGERLVAIAELGDRFSVAVFDGEGTRLGYRELGGTPVSAAFAPDSHRVALVRTIGARGEALLLDADDVKGRLEQIFAGAGELGEAAWSPDAEWLLLAWPSADQLLFVRTADVEEVKAVSNVSRQFAPGGTGLAEFPVIAGWCCPAEDE